jgi:hypothetical protein
MNINRQKGWRITFKGPTAYSYISSQYKMPLALSADSAYTHTHSGNTIYKNKSEKLLLTY